MAIECDTYDIVIDEQTSLYVTVDAVTPTGGVRDISGVKEIVWVASSNDNEMIRKSLSSMLIMLSPQTSTYVNTNSPAGQKTVYVNSVDNFGYDGYGRMIANLAVGDTVRLTNASGQTELGVIAQVVPGASDYIVMVDNLTYTYPSGTSNTVKKIISSFEFQLLPGDTILPSSKVYGFPVVWEHMAMASWTATSSPLNPSGYDIKVPVARGKMYITPIFDIV